ncbi:MAG TPA: Hpt domain-containing protein [Steroidobacteraceae bacterium]|jgi:chemosensory pili system protein ChpA (sensor histidine kinase/response regulator)
MAELSSQTLHIVARELNSELNDARTALEAFGEQQDNVALLRKCGEHLRSVHGALRIAEVYGAALLAEEMGQVARYLIDNFSERRHLAEGLDALMRAMVQLPTYLERVMSGGRDMALVLLPLLNDLRAVRGHALLSEGTLLLLNLSSDQQASPVQPQGEALTIGQWARKLRTRYQLGLLGWIKGERVDQNLEILSRSAEKLEQVATTQPVFQLWWVVGAVLEALREGGLDGSASIKRLLGHADREMKRLYEQGEGRYADSPPLELLNNLLYYVARARSSGPRVAAVRASFRLTELLPVDDHIEQARESLSAPSVKLMKTVAAAIKEDLGRVKDALDIFVRQGGTQVDELAPQLELLKKIADTLGVLGLGELRDKVQGETGDLQAIVNQRSAAGEGTLLRMAATLIKVEDSLDEQLVGMIVPSAGSAAPAKPAGPEDIEFRQVTEAVLRECIVNMARIKEAVALSFEKPREAQAMDQIPQLMRGMIAGLLMLGKTRVVEIMEGVDRALGQLLRSDGMTLPQEAVDRLADAIVAVEYYMETLQAGRADPWYMLDNAENCLRFLAEAQPIPRAEVLAQTTDHARTVVIEPPLATPTQTLPTEHEPTAVLDPVSAVAVRQPARSATPPATPPKALDREIDPEFLELFIEEAKDEITKLKRLFPLWDENPQDQDSLVNVRRSFHTLKGSGRMVGAQLIGEFAWAVENLLNRVINKTLERSPEMMTLLREAVAAVPELVEQLESGRAPQANLARIIEGLNTIAGVRPSAPALAPSAPSISHTQTTTVLTPPSPPVAPPSASPQKKTAPAPDIRPPAPEPMDPGLHEIYAKETAGHLATLREFIAACDLATPPYVITEDVHRSCHTLSGTAKTAGARQGIKIAEPLNRYVRKLYDNSIGMPAAGLAVLKDASAAIQQVVDHIDENTGFFLDHPRIAARLGELERELDEEIARLAETVESTMQAPVVAHAATVVLHAVPAAPAEAAAADVVELEPTDANALSMLDWSYDNFPPAPAVVDDRSPTHDMSPTMMRPLPVFRDDPTARAEALADDAPTNVQSALEDGDPTNVQPALVEGDVLASLTYEAPESGIVVEEAAADASLEIEIDASAFEQSQPVVEPQPQPAPPVVAEVEDVLAEEESDTVRSPALSTVEPPPVVAAAPPPPPPAPPVLAVETSTDDGDDADFDAEVAAIFSEEATELLETADQALSSWKQDRANTALVFELKRVVHTLKGGARMAGIRAMGNLSHELETLMQGVEAGNVAAAPAVFDAFQASLDQLHRMRDVVNRGERCPHAHELINRIRALGGHAPIAAPAAAPAAPPVAAPAEPVVAEDFGAATGVVPTLTESFAPEAVQDEAAEQAVPALDETDFDIEFDADELGAAAPREAVRVEEPVAAQPTLDVAAQQPELLPDTPEAPEPLVAEHAAPVLPGREAQVQERQEFARVDADLLDTLLNNAGEVSIFRSRLEQQVSSIEFNLAELGRTVTRLKEQLRKLELETEAQILHRHEEEHPGRADFDPLELDRYSTIQQLSRAFAESVSDVGSIEGLLENLTREAQNLLLQQSRVVTELQNGLMRTRMVPFQRHVQRLSRLVRQVATDTGKKAELVVVGASGELDRQVLERMLPPFEHMLRNSVVHGIETPQERAARGKSESGTIRVGLHREGSEMVIVLEDDGRGIDVGAVRARARERGLLQPGRVLSDEEALQLILEPGFSTASNITQHAGRGVGMDVVVNEIKKLGGALFTESQPGLGVKFTIRLPFTLAITQALIVRTGEELYALPLPSVEGVARVPRSEVQKHLAEESPTFTYGKQVYRLQHLGAFIGGGASVLPEADVSMPLILIRAGDHSTAVVTDELVGSREMVVKSVGPQIAGIRGIAGATILGDGRIVIILDLGALVRSEWRGRKQLAVEGPTEDRRTFALVVDDSITVRRVTQRLLERHGMRVMTAKDGVDALSILQDHLPDVILLDIEMPRMDGYELASQVRADARLADIPIVMITSRVGEKHRARAIELGVNDYLGKPYQESQLLDAIEPLVQARRRKAAAPAQGRESRA